MQSSQAAAFSSACSGAIGAVVALTITYPLSIIKTRLQAQTNIQYNNNNNKDGKVYIKSHDHKPYFGSIDCLQRIVKEEGAFKLYAGLRGALFKAFITNFVFYFFHGLFQKFIRARSMHRGKSIRAFWSMMHGIMAGICVQLCVLPIDMVVTRIQINRGAAPKGFVRTMYDITKEGGIFSFWNGLIPGMWLTLNPGITTAVRNVLEEYVNGSSYNTSANFGVGLVSKATASIITYPYTVCKVRMQISGVTNNEKEKRNENSLENNYKEEKKKPKGVTFIETVKLVYNENGMVGFYNGLPPQLVNAVLKEGILNMIRLEIRVMVESNITARLMR